MNYAVNLSSAVPAVYNARFDLSIVGDYKYNQYQQDKADADELFSFT